MTSHHRQVLPSCSKAVSFNNTVHVKETIHLNEYNEREIFACYYSRNDLRDFKQDVKRIARLIEVKQRVDETKSSKRGAEMWTVDVSKLRSRNRLVSLCVVFNEQAQQEHLGNKKEDSDCCFYDDEKIAKVYSQVARESAASAYKIGLSDAMAADSHYDSHQQEASADNGGSSRVFSKLRNASGSFRIRSYASLFPSAA